MPSSSPVLAAGAVKPIDAEFAEGGENSMVILEVLTNKIQAECLLARGLTLSRVLLGLF